MLFKIKSYSLSNVQCKKKKKKKAIIQILLAETMATV